MAPDQAHEQNNKVIKGTSGATQFLNRQDTSELERWELCRKISRIMTELEPAANFRATGAPIEKRLENTLAFRNFFYLMSTRFCLV